VAEHAGQAHSSLLLPMVTRLLAGHGLDLGDLDGIVFGRGPGSFPGLRIACSVAPGLAMGSGLPVLGVSTLEALAEESGARRVVACLDARMNEVYAAVLVRQGERWHGETGAMVCPPEAAPLPGGDDYLGCGSGFAAYAERLSTRYGGRLSGVVPDLIPHARALARLAAPRFQAGEFVPPEEAEPYYVRDKVALTIRERT